MVTDRTTEMIEPADYNFGPERKVEAAACKWVAFEGKMAVRILIAVVMESMEHSRMSMVMVERNLAEVVKCTHWVALCTRTPVYCTQVDCTLVYCTPVDCKPVYNSVVVAGVEVVVIVVVVVNIVVVSAVAVVSSELKLIIHYH